MAKQSERPRFATEAEERAITKFFEPKTFTFTGEKPLQVQPVLTPDNYADVVRQLIESARKKIYFQNQYITVSPAATKGFDALLDALTAKIKAGLDVKIILRSMPEARKMLEALQYRGFDASAIRLQASCHNKGIVVDSKVVALGSHNWSSEGTTLNRDATLVIHHPEVAAYYEEIFLHDWENQARAQTLAPEAMPVVKHPGKASRRDVGSEAVAWTDYYED